MKNARVVIGANFGDEGKGLMTDYFASLNPSNSLVVRFNGGAQAGHTVIANGERHVFSHLGSGTLAGAHTYLSKHFIFNPLIFRRELEEISSKLPNRSVLVSANPDALLSTPYDVYLNRAAEEQRQNRHGSCGIGINETVTRCLAGFKTTLVDLLNTDALIGKLEFIRDIWVPDRARALGITLDTSRFTTIYEYVEDCKIAKELLYSISVIPHSLMPSDVNIIFEGAQGLLLDEFNGVYPHVTRSRTGLTNVIQIADQWGIKELDVTYVTRTYLTRHGAGPLNGESEELKQLIGECETNKPNEWQGSIRYAPLNVQNLYRRIREDSYEAWLKDTDIKINKSIALTWMDKWYALKPAPIFNDKFIPVKCFSFGPNRKDIEVLKNKVHFA